MDWMRELGTHIRVFLEIKEEKSYSFLQPLSWYKNGERLPPFALYSGNFNVMLGLRTCIRLFLSRDLSGHSSNWHHWIVSWFFSASPYECRNNNLKYVTMAFFLIFIYLHFVIISSSYSTSYKLFSLKSDVKLSKIQYNNQYINLGDIQPLLRYCACAVCIIASVTNMMNKWWFYVSVRNIKRQENNQLDYEWWSHRGSGYWALGVGRQPKRFLCKTCLLTTSQQPTPQRCPSSNFLVFAES
jgi:hypothetical protein